LEWNNVSREIEIMQPQSELESAGGLDINAADLVHLLSTKLSSVPVGF
jgi:hypothetical protein